MKVQIDDISQAFQLTTRLKAKGVPVSFKAHQTTKGRKAPFHEIIVPEDFENTVKEEMNILGVFASEENGVVKPSSKKRAFLSLW